jgi:hypothetical protein
MKTNGYALTLPFGGSVFGLFRERHSRPRRRAAYISF